MPLEFMKKVAIFVDVQNIYYTTKQIHKCHFDYNAFWAKANFKQESGESDRLCD